MSYHLRDYVLVDRFKIARVRIFSHVGMVSERVLGVCRAKRNCGKQASALTNFRDVFVGEVRGVDEAFCGVVLDLGELFTRVVCLCVDESCIRVYR